MLIEPRKFSTWAPGEIKNGVYVPPELKGTITDAGEYIPPETEEPDEMEKKLRDDVPMEMDDRRFGNCEKQDATSNGDGLQREKHVSIRIVFRVSALSLSMVASFFRQR